ncbi:kinase [Hazenella coriacea]|uniref:Threonine kinase n=1 Tax=Hazenella coriacea TaxID=1179467 RepID=A0A4V6NZ71_9BACL|nr:kinase [Hazenella coriacea]TCS92397.1 threonine kinase [Hazenella coriacea]
MSVSQQPVSKISSSSYRIGTGQSFGTFGELLQGVFEDETNFLVTLPIARYSKASFISHVEIEEIEVFPSYKKKSQQLASQILHHFGLPAGGYLKIESELPEGKGLASSSADLVATARSIEECFQIEIPMELLETLMSKIEPSDGVMYPGIVSYCHRKVELYRFMGSLPSITIIGIDEGGEVDTLDFNRIPKEFTLEEKKEYFQLHQQITLAIQEQDLETVGKVATRSAVLNQRFQPKANLDLIMELSDSIGGLGVAVAHSGTYLGLLLSSIDPQYEEKYRKAYEYLSKLDKEMLICHSLNFEEGLESC